MALYEALLAVDVQVPAWALSDVAGAYLLLRQPRQAEVLYRRVLVATPDNFDANLGLFYALVESEQLALAQAHIDRFAASLPVRRHLDGQPNGVRWSAEVASDQARLYADRIVEAQRRIEQRLAVTPFNIEARSAEASLHLARGGPRQGEADLRRAIGSDPRNPGLHADRAEVLLSLQDWEQARTELVRARSLDAENPRVRQADRTFDLHELRELYVDAGYGVGQTSNPSGSSDVSGVIATFRRSALFEAGFWSPDKLTEDVDITWKLQLAGWEVRFETRALCWILMPETLKGLWNQRLRWATGGAQVIFDYWSEIWPRPRMWPVFVEYSMSILWAFCMALLVAYRIADLVFYKVDLQSAPVLMLGWAGLLIGTTCLVQMMLSLWLDRPYDQGLLKNYFWMIWYPFIYWVLSATTAVAALPAALARRSGKRATWISPDRGISPDTKNANSKR